MTKTRVLVIDDSAVIRQTVTQILSADPELEVIGAAADPFAALEKIQRQKPDVLTLDVEMPRMDGLTFLEKLMRAYPIPVVMLSSLTEKGCDTTLRALELGAIDFITKPKIDVKQGTAEIAGVICRKVKAAARAKVSVRRAPAAAQSPVLTIAPQALIKSTHQVIAIGASTGGTEALREVLAPLPADSPGIVIVLHMPERFTKSFADRLNAICRLQVKEARDGDRILPGHALLAPGNQQMEVRRRGAEYSVRVFPGEMVNHHCPSVDVLFSSCARHLGSNAVGVILTGMGNDGAQGLLEMRRAGARTIAQDEATSIVFGMPREAIVLGGAQETLPIGRIAERMLRLAAE